VLEAARAGDRMAGAVYGAHLGLADEEVRPEAEWEGRAGPYLSTLILPRARAGRGGRP
jgi:precorrin-2/cobalt-factor-2 C20-methyltransferase